MPLCGYVNLEGIRGGTNLLDDQGGSFPFRPRGHLSTYLSIYTCLRIETPSQDGVSHFKINIDDLLAILRIEIARDWLMMMCV